MTQADRRQIPQIEQMGRPGVGPGAPGQAFEASLNGSIIANG